MKTQSLEPENNAAPPEALEMNDRYVPAGSFVFTIAPEFKVVSPPLDMRTKLRSEVPVVILALRTSWFATIEPVVRSGWFPHSTDA